MSPNHDPAASRESHSRRTVVTLEGIAWLFAIVALWSVGWVKGINLILLLSYLLLALWVLNWFAARRALRGLTARRVAPEPAFAGDETPWRVEIVSQSAKPLLGWDLVDESGKHSVRWPILNLAPRGVERLRRVLRFHTRGTFECRPLRAVSSFPFGLVRQEVRFHSNDRFVVYPAIGTVNLHRLRSWLMHASRPDERRHRTRRRMAQEVEFHGLRSFRPGDSPRWIHWRTSARRGELMVREFDQGSHFDLLLIVEAYESDRTPSHLEAAVSMAATVAWHWAKDGGDRVVLALAGETCVVHATRDGRDPVGGVLNGLANVRGSARPDFDALAARLDSIGLPYGPAMFISSRGSNKQAIDKLSARLKRPLAYLDATNPADFYVPPQLLAAK
jgi:uncharacterized protein (DUF58 family)